LSQTRDLGRPIRVDSALTPQPIELARIVPGDLQAADGLPMPLLSSEDVTVLLSRRREPMPFCWRNADGDELYFIHRGECRFETEFGQLTANPGDFVYLGRNVIYRLVPLGEDNLHLILQTRELLELADQYHRAYGLTNQSLDLSRLVLPELAPIAEDPLSTAEYEVRTRLSGELYSTVYDFDPVGVTVGWVGDPVVFKLSAWEIGAARSPYTPPTHAAFMTETRDCVVGVHRPAGVHLPPGHSNDWDEIWFLHAATSSPGVGLLRWDTQGLTQAMFTTPKPAAPDTGYRLPRAQHRREAPAPAVPRGGTLRGRDAGGRSSVRRKRERGATGRGGRPPGRRLTGASGLLPTPSHGDGVGSAGVAQRKGPSRLAA
jgi:homogentisate 1,2-dioxygenase